MPGKSLHRNMKHLPVTTGLMAGCVLLLALGSACSVPPQEEPILRMEQYLEQLEADWNSGINRQSPVDQAKELRSLYQAVEILDPAELDKELEIRRSHVMGEGDLYLMVLLDEALRLPEPGADISSWSE